MFTEIPVLATDYSYPELPRISFAQYSQSCELNAEQDLELLQLVAITFDGQYGPEILYPILRKLNPAVFLLTVLDPHDKVREQWPCLSDATLDLIDERCNFILGHGLPAHEQAVNELLAQALIPIVSKPAPVEKPGDQPDPAVN